MARERTESPLLSVDVDNDVNVTLQVGKQEIHSKNGLRIGRVVCLLVNDTPVMLNKFQAERLAGQIKRLSKQIDLQIL